MDPSQCFCYLIFWWRFCCDTRWGLNPQINLSKSLTSKVKYQLSPSVWAPFPYLSLSGWSLHWCPKEMKFMWWHFLRVNPSPSLPVAFKPISQFHTHCLRRSDVRDTKFKLCENGKSCRRDCNCGASHCHHAWNKGHCKSSAFSKYIDAFSK